tara:strand:- start:346 stop:552 length:207 start_codon:yes stop_codon:yes gene_type:complete
MNYSEFTPMDTENIIDNDFFTTREELLRSALDKLKVEFARLELEHLKLKKDYVNLELENNILKSNNNK